MYNNETIWVSAIFFSIFFGGIMLYWHCTKQTINEKNKPNNHETAFIETQKALKLLSENLNIGMKSVIYINEYENSIDLIFKRQEP